MTADITVVETNGEHFVSIRVDGHPLRQHGPYASVEAAKAEADQLAGICQGLLHADATGMARRGRR